MMLPSISKNLAGPPHPTSPPVAEILVLRIREIARCRTIPRGSASTLDLEMMPSAHESKRDRARRCLVPGVECQVSRLQLRNTGVLECWSNASHKSSSTTIPFFHFSSIPIFHHSIIPISIYDKPNSL